MQVAGGQSWTSLAGGIAHSCGVRADGALWCWGDNVLGQLGTDVGPWSALPTHVGAISTWVSVVSGYNSTLALRTDASAWRWGAAFWTTAGEPVLDPERF